MTTGIRIGTATATEIGQGIAIGTTEGGNPTEMAPVTIEDVLVQGSVDHLPLGSNPRTSQHQHSQRTRR